MNIWEMVLWGIGSGIALLVAVGAGVEVLVRLTWLWEDRR